MNPEYVQDNVSPRLAGHNNLLLLMDIVIGGQKVGQDAKSTLHLAGNAKGMHTPAYSCILAEVCKHIQYGSPTLKALTS